MALSDDDFADLQTAATLARETAETDGWHVITDRIKQRVALRQEKMISGNCESWEEYQKFSHWLDCALWVLLLPNLIEQEVEDHRRVRMDEEPA